MDQVAAEESKQRLSADAVERLLVVTLVCLQVAWFGAMLWGAAGVAAWLF